MGSACSTQKALKNVEEPQKFSNDKPKKVLRASVSKNDQKATSETKKEEHRRSSSSMEKSPAKNQTNHDPVNTSNTSTEDKKSSIIATKVSNRPLSKYEKRDEHLMSTWGNWLNGQEKNKFVANDEVYYFEMNNFFPDCLFLDIEGDIDMESIVFVRVRGHSTVIATMLQKADYKNDLNYLTSIQIPKSIESDKILFPIIQSLVYSLPEKVDKPFTVTEERRNYFIEGNEDFNNIMKETENALISIEEQNTFPSDFKGSIFMNTCLGMPLLHFAVSKNNNIPIQQQYHIFNPSCTEGVFLSNRVEYIVGIRIQSFSKPAFQNPFCFSKSLHLRASSCSILKKMSRVITKKELEEHDENHKDQWIAVDGKVYTITEYKHEHPGGEDILLEHAGADASEAFENVGHSKDARNKLKSLLVGELEGYKSSGAKDEVSSSTTTSTSSSGSSVMPIIVGLVALVVAVGVYVTKISQ